MGQDTGIPVGGKSNFFLDFLRRYVEYSYVLILIK